MKQSQKNSNYKIPIILPHKTTIPSFLIFNPNDWIGESKAIIHACAMQYGLLLYNSAIIKELFQNVFELCQPGFTEFKKQWDLSQWPIEKGDHLIQIPEIQLQIQSFFTTIKILLDLLVQLISSEKIANVKVHAFHKEGEEVGGQLLKILKSNVPLSKRNKACEIDKFLTEQKSIWIDQIVNYRDIFIHPKKVLSPHVMLKLEIRADNRKLQLIRIIKPSINNQEFDEYASTILQHIEVFSRTFLQIIKMPNKG